MKVPTIIAITTVTVLMSGCGEKDTRPNGSSNPNPDPLSGMRKLVDRSQVVAYGSVDTNNVPNFALTVSEIWKGVSEASVLGITNGTHFPFQWLTTKGDSLDFPDHAILIIPHADSPSVALERRAIFYFYDERFLGMTTQEYKAKFGL